MRRALPRKKLWSVLRAVIGTAIFVITVIIAGMAVYARLQHGQFLSVQTGSMMPRLHRGDLIVVTRISPNQLKRGDIITFINPHDNTQTVTHRLIAIPAKLGHDQFQTKGDANDLADMPIASSDIVGKIRFTLPKVGYVVNALRKPLGLTLIIYIPALIIIAGELQRLAAYYKGGAESRNEVHYKLKHQARRDVGSAQLPTKHIGQSALLLVVLALGLLFVAPMVQAALSTRAILTSNTISGCQSTPCTN